MTAALAAVALLGSGTRPATAQQVVVLQDGDVDRLLPVLAAAREEGDRRRDAVTAMLADKDASARFHENVQAGHVDLEAVLRRHAPRAAVPPDARYDAACSGSLVLPGSSAGIRGWFMTAYVLPAADAANGRAVAFYRARGFRVSTTGRESTWLEWPDAHADSLQVGVGRIFASNDIGTGCRHLVGTPVIVLRLPNFGFSEHLRAAAPAVTGAVADHARALRMVGLTEEAFDELLAAAMLARSDADDEGMAEQLRMMAEHIPEARAGAHATAERRLVRAPPRAARVGARRLS